MPDSFDLYQSGHWAIPHVGVGFGRFFGGGAPLLGERCN